MGGRQTKALESTILSEDGRYFPAPPMRQEKLDMFPRKFSTLGVDKDFSCQNTVKIVQSETGPGFFPLLAVWATLMAVAGWLCLSALHDLGVVS